MGTFSNNLTEIIASALHYHDEVELQPSERKTAAEIRDMSEGGRQRYLNDSVFNARVQSITGSIMQAMQHCIERDVADHYINYGEEKS